MQTTSEVAGQVSRKVSRKLSEMGTSPDREGSLTKAVETQTAKIPSIAFLFVGLGCIVASAGLQLAGRRTLANFIGLWTPTILIMGLYDKVVKVHGSERHQESYEPHTY